MRLGRWALQHCRSRSKVARIRCERSHVTEAHEDEDASEEDVEAEEAAVDEEVDVESPVDAL